MIPNLADKLKKLRLQAGLSQVALANRVGLDRSMITNYEKGVRQPSLEVLVKLAMQLHTTTDYLLGIDINQDERFIKVVIEGLSPNQVELYSQLISAVSNYFNNNVISQEGK